MPMFGNLQEVEYKGQPLRVDMGADKGPGGPPAGVYWDKGASAYKKPQPVYRTAPEMVAIKHRLFNEFAMRDMLYRFLQRIYDGEFWRVVSEEIRTGGFKYHRYKVDERYRLTVNYIFSQTNDYVDLLSKIPSIHVPALHESDDSARILAVQNEKLLYGIWEASHMSNQMNDLAWHLSLLGTSVIESTPDPTDFVPKLLVQHPAQFYPKSRFGRPGEMMYGVKRFFLEPDQVADAFGKAWRNNNRYVSLDTATGQWVESNDFTSNTARVEGWFFYSPWERALFLQDQIVNEYSVQFDEEQEIPWRVIFFIKRPGKSYGMGAAEQTWGLNQYLNQLYSHEANILAYAANPILVVKNPQQVDEDIPNDPGAVITVGEQGEVKWLSWSHQMPDLNQQMERTKKYLQDLGGMPESRYGNIRQSFATGRAVEQLNMPTQDRIASRMRLMAEELQHINRIALKQFERIAKNRTVELYGDSQMHGAFSMKMKGSDVKGYYRNFVTWDAHDHGDAVEILQQLGAGILDKRTAIVELGRREPDQILKRVRQDRLDDIEVTRLFEAAKMANVSPQQEQSLVPGRETASVLASAGPMQQQAGLEAGGMPQSGGMPGSGAVTGGPPTPPSAAPAPSAGPAEGPVSGSLAQATALGSNAPTSPIRRGFGPSANLHLNAPGQPGTSMPNGGIFHLGTTVGDFRALPAGKIRGSIYLYGHITEGAASKIQVFLTAGVDKKTIIDNLPPDYNGHLLFRIGSTPPPGAVDVTPNKSSIPGGSGPGGVPAEPDLSGRNAPGNRANPTGLVGPMRQDHLVTPVYQPLPLPAPGVGPLPGQPLGQG